MQYCTVQDVKNTLLLLNQDFNEINPPLDDRISEAIDEATSMAKNLLQSRYSIATIESDLPFDVKSFTKIKAALITINREGVAADNNTNDYIERAKETLGIYKMLFLHGSLRNGSDIVIPTNLRTVFNPSSSNSGILEVYE